MEYILPMYLLQLKCYTYQMADYSRDRFSRGGGGGGFKRRDFNDRPSRGPVEMHQATCDNCGKSCEVPFRPTSGKPVYCSNCFESKKGGSEPRRYDSPREETRVQPSFNQPNYSAQFDTLNSKLDNILKILESAVTEEEVIEEEIAEVAPVEVAPKVKKLPKKQLKPQFNLV